jgi:hypothetical protein
MSKRPRASARKKLVAGRGAKGTTQDVARKQAKRSRRKKIEIWNGERDTDEGLPPPPLKIAGSSAIASTTLISVWEDDPLPGVLVDRPPPGPGKSLAFRIGGKQPAPNPYKTGTPQFRYWTAADALRRCADFWSKVAPVRKWDDHVGSTLKVLLDEGDELNAYYDRRALNFFHGDGPDGATVYSCESPDVVCHEMGHAVLDALKPQLWSAASHETSAFHEAFGDMSAILSALQLPSMRKAAIEDTKGKLYRSSRLSRLAEQLGAAIRQQHPDAVERDCLRNAVNSFTYRDPTTLPQGAPAWLLSSEPHSFSRIFTGAFFEMLAGMFAAQGQQPDEADLEKVSRDLGGILAQGVLRAPVVANWYAQVAAAMVNASAAFDPRYPAILNAAFVNRSILSLSSAGRSLHVQQGLGEQKEYDREIAAARLSLTALGADHYGLNQPLIVESASHPRRFIAQSAATMYNGSLDPTSSATAAVAFVDDLFSRGRVECGDFKGPVHRLNHGKRMKTHKLVSDDGEVKLERTCFDCGLHF